MRKGKGERCRKGKGVDSMVVGKLLGKDNREDRTVQGRRGREKGRRVKERERRGYGSRKVLREGKYR